MSLLHQTPNEKANIIARKVFDRHFEMDPKLNTEYDERRKHLMYEDILYNLEYLNAAMEFDDDKIFIDYSIWLYQLMCQLMKDLDRERIKEQMVSHYKILNAVIAETLPREEAEKADHHLHNAIAATEKEAVGFTTFDRFESGRYIDVKKEYLNLLVNNDTKAAVKVIGNAEKSGIELDDIYVEILQEVMCEVGNLWHKNVLTIDKEHYCTAATQVALSQFQPIIFSRPRNGYKILACCVGSELHEMGIRMLSDVFENHGWDSIYLGAAVPREAVLNSINEHKPDLVALSVTMPQHLYLCLEVVNAIREKCKDIKIAVGGRAFASTQALWKKWDVDISTENAVQLVEWAEKNIVKVNERKCYD